MAQGDFTIFNSFLEKLGDGVLAPLSTEEIRLGLVGTGAPTPTQTTADPRWGAQGTTDLSTQKLATGGNYTNSAGIDLTVTITDPWTITGAQAKLDLDDVSIDQSATNPATKAYWGILYIDDAGTPPDRYCIGYIDLDTGTGVDLRAGDFTIQWDTGGVFTMTKT